ncbi:nuclear transport factor 2 family protein [Longibacter sp.]|jgi:ketosteroid isomerase-like protein|uniref:nuclear transport factor 2 family protein n=1 Tax=Longibacter sp. TaxID=2045415 RepID=UPI003EC05EB1
MSRPTVESTAATRTPSYLVKEVSDTIVAFFDAMNRQDLDQMERITAHDPDAVHIGTDTDEIWRGWSHLHADTIEQFESLDVYEATIRDLAVHVSPAGDVAWYSHLLDAEIRSSHGAQSWFGARFTGVLKKDEGQWLLAQTHVSLPESHVASGP